jgi:mannose-6-phosphate isomerase-like protein (cupin superfamily)
MNGGVRTICTLSIIGATLCATQQRFVLCAVRVQVERARSSISAMSSVERRNFLKLAVALSFAPPRSFAEVASPLGKPVFVAAGADATGTEHHGPRAGTHLDFKVLTKDTQTGFFLVEHRDVPQGGPVRHLHYAQEEWFYLIEGNKLVIEVGDERFTLRPGDSILAPRNVPHVWAYVGEKPGRMLRGSRRLARWRIFLAFLANSQWMRKSQRHTA